MSDGAGVLPDRWTEAALGELGNWAGGGTPSKKNAAYWNGGTVPWVSPKDMGPLVLSDTEDHITELATVESSARVLPADSIAFVVRSGILGRTLPIARVPFEAAYNQDMRVLVPAPSLHTGWLLWALVAAAEDIRRRCRKDGVTVESIEVPQLQAYRLRIPPRAEQERIATLLDRTFAQLDVGERNLRDAAAALSVYGESVLVSALTGRLGNEGSTADASELRTRILSKRKHRWEEAGLSRYSEPAVPKAPTNIELPAGWCWATVDELSVGVQYGSSAKTSPEGDVPVLRMGNLVGGDIRLGELKYLPADHDEFPGLFLKEGDLLFNRTNSPELVGKTAIARGLPIPCSFASYLIRVRLAPEIEPELVSWYLNSPFGRAWVRDNVSQQVGQANVNGSKLRALTVPLPPRNTQARIREHALRLVGAGVRMRTALSETLQDVGRLRQSLLFAAQRGELGTGDNYDEPADALLTRIRSERELRETHFKAARKQRRAALAGR